MNHSVLEEKILYLKSYKVTLGILNWNELFTKGSVVRFQFIEFISGTNVFYIASLSFDMGLREMASMVLSQGF